MVRLAFPLCFKISPQRMNAANIRLSTLTASDSNDEKQQFEVMDYMSNIISSPGEENI